MEITEVKVFPVQEEKLKAFVSVVFDRCFMVNDIKIIQGRQGLFISMPSRKKKNGDFKDVAHPLNNDTRRMIETTVLAEYDRVLEERDGDAPATPEGRPEQQEQQDEKATPIRAQDQDLRPPGETTEEETAEKTLEEVEEMHLRDSFWTVP